MKRKKIVFGRLAGLMLASVLIVACTTDFDWKKMEDEHLNGQALAIPIGYINTSIGKMLDKLDSIKHLGTEGEVIYLHYLDTAEWKIKAYEMPTKSDPVTRNYSPSSDGVSVLPANKDFKATFVEDVPLGINTNPLEQRIDSVKIGFAKIRLEASSTIIGVHPKDVKIVISFPNKRLVFDTPGFEKITYTFDALNPGKQIEIPPFTIHVPGNATSIPMQVELHIRTGNAPVAITPASKLSYTIQLVDTKMKVAYGYFKPSDTNSFMYEESDLGNFQNSLPKGLFGFMDPKVDITLINKQGINLGFNLQYAKAYRKGEVDYDTIFAKFEDGSQSMRSIIKPAPRYGQESITKYTFDNKAGHIHRLFSREKMPNMVAYKYSLTNEPRPETDFITSDPKLDVVFDIKLPFHFNSGSYIHLKDTMKDLNIDSILAKQELDKAMIVLHITNGLPVQTDFRLELLNDKNKKMNKTIDSVFVVNAAPVNANGFVDKALLKMQEIKIEINKEQIAELRNATKMAYNVRFNRKEAIPFKFETSNTLAIKAGIYLSGKRTINHLFDNK